MVALVGLGNQFVDLAVGDLGQDAVAFANRQQDGVQHFVDALHDFAIDPVKLVGPAALGETAIPGRVHQAHDFLRNQQHLAVPRFLRAARPAAGTMPVPTVARSVALQLSAFVYNFSWHDF